MKIQLFNIILYIEKICNLKISLKILLILKFINANLF